MHKPASDLDRLYLAVREDLSPGLAAAQIAHAAFAFAAQHPDLTGPWQRHSQYLVIVSVPDEVALIALASRALEAEIEITTWAEPDLSYQKTALALQPGAVARRLCANMPLHGRHLAAAG